MRIFFYCLITLISLKLYGQNPSLTTKTIDDILELLSPDLEALEINDPNFLENQLQLLQNLLSNPINLNSSQDERLENSALLNPIQLKSLKEYISKNDKLIALHELQAVPYFDLKTIHRILPFVSLKDAEKQHHLPFLKLFSNGQTKMYLKVKSVLENQRAYEENQYLGSQLAQFIRLKYNYLNKVQYGFTFQKDPGEKDLLDFSSFHLFIKKIHPKINLMALGDFNINLGQGLIINPSFGTGKSALVLNVKKGGDIFKAYNSVNEAFYNRGFGIELNLSQKFQLACFASYKNNDALISLDSVSMQSYFRTIKVDGYHRTLTELEAKHAIKNTKIGGRFKYDSHFIKLSVNLLNERFSAIQKQEYKPYRLHNFSGSSLFNGSLDFDLVYKNLNLFGEFALSQNLKSAQFYGLFLSLDKAIDLVFVYRNYHPQYWNLNANAFGEGTTGQNEIGQYIGIKLNLNSNFSFFFYFDLWRHPWLRFNKDAPPRGHESLYKFEYIKKRKFRFYIQISHERKEENSRLEHPISVLDLNNKLKIRVHFNHKLNKHLEMRNRVEWNKTIKSQDPSLGFIIYQDLIIKPIGSKFSLTSRFAYFQTHNFDSRIYSYENDIIGEFFIPFYYNTGSRFYLNFRYKIFKYLSLEGRFAQTHYQNLDEIGSGLERIDGSKKSEVKFQIQMTF